MKILSPRVLSILLFMVVLSSCSSTDPTRTAVMESIEQNNPDEVKLMVLYPQPTDAAQFDRDYQDHLELLNEKAGIPENSPLPYTVTKFFPSPDGGPADFYQVFIMTFSSAEALQQAMSTSGMQEVAADAARISTGGPPVVMVGSEEVQ